MEQILIDGVEIKWDRKPTGNWSAMMNTPHTIFPKRFAEATLAQLWTEIERFANTQALAEQNYRVAKKWQLNWFAVAVAAHGQAEQARDANL